MYSFDFVTAVISMLIYVSETHSSVNQYRGWHTETNCNQLSRSLEMCAIRIQSVSTGSICFLYNAGA